jgi:hypothetical protein
MLIRGWLIRLSVSTDDFMEVLLHILKIHYFVVNNFLDELNRDRENLDFLLDFQVILVFFRGFHCLNSLDFLFGLDMLLLQSLLNPSIHVFLLKRLLIHQLFLGLLFLLYFFFLCDFSRFRLVLFFFQFYCIVYWNHRRYIGIADFCFKGTGEEIARFGIQF